MKYDEKRLKKIDDKDGTTNFIKQNTFHVNQNTQEKQLYIKVKLYT